MSTTTITHTAHAYMWSWDSLDDIKSGRVKPYVTERLKDDDSSLIPIGTAEVTVTINEKVDVTGHLVAALNKELATVRAENQQRENVILDKIRNLQALEFNGSPA